MNIKQETIDFLTENLCETRASYYINLFRSMSEREFTDRIEKYCYLASKYEREHFLGKLDGDSTLLLITAMIMRNAIYRRENNLIHSDGVSIYASKSEIEKAREDYEEAEGQISKASKDYLKAKNKLFQNIQKSFEKELSFLLESKNLLKTEADFYYQRPGYDFRFYGQDIYVINWYPMGGD